MTKNTIKIMTTIQALMLSAYGFCAILLHRSMMSYDLYSVSNAGSPVHLCYLITTVLGMLLIIRGLVKDRHTEGYFKSVEFLTPAVVTAICFVFSQANTVYTSTSGGSFGGFIGYVFRAALSGSDPIDAFVYGSLTITKYLFVVVAGLIAASVTLLKKPASENAEATIAVKLFNTDAIKAHAAAAVEEGSRLANKASVIAGAALDAAKEAAHGTVSNEDSTVNDTGDEGGTGAML